MAKVFLLLRQELEQVRREFYIGLYIILTLDQVVHLKGLSPGGTLPLGTLSGGRAGLRGLATDHEIDSMAVINVLFLFKHDVHVPTG
jgi:hypothetical protein